MEGRANHTQAHVTCAHPIAPADLFARVDGMARGWPIPCHLRFALCASDEQRTAHHTTSSTTRSHTEGDRMHSRIACVIRRANVGIVIRLGSGPVYVLSMLPASPCADTRPTPAAIAATAATPVQRTAHRCVPGTRMFRSGRVSHAEVGPETMHRHTHVPRQHTHTQRRAHSLLITAVTQGVRLCGQRVPLSPLCHSLARSPHPSKLGHECNAMRRRGDFIVSLTPGIALVRYFGTRGRF